MRSDSHPGYFCLTFGENSSENLNIALRRESHLEVKKSSVLKIFFKESYLCNHLKIFPHKKYIFHD